LSLPSPYAPFIKTNSELVTVFKLPKGGLVFREGFHIGRFFGINVSINWSWIFIFLLITGSLGVGVFPILHPEWGFFLVWGVSIAASILFFASVLAHEIAHSVVARSRGLPVDQITLFIFGGVSNIEREPEKPATEFLMAIVGPLTSIVLGVVFTLLGVLAANGLRAFTGASGQVLASLDPISTLLLWLGPINVILGVFNLIPGFPLDGGRVLRSILWAATGNLKKATQWASWIGQGFGWFFILIGIGMVLGIEVPFFGTGLIGGLWLVFIGWFLSSMAAQGYQQVLIEDVLRDVKVSSIMRRSFPKVTPEVTVSELINEHIMGTEDRAFLVMQDDALEGIVTLDDVRKAAREDWDKTTVEQIMTAESELESVSSSDRAVDALQKITSRDVNQLPVIDEGKLTGLINRRDILLWLQTHSGNNFPS
jgi:Zn-dependent protease/CBS domain-containing protein